MHIGLHRLRSEEGFAESDNALIRMDQNPEQVRPFRHADGLEFCDFHEVSPPPEAGRVPSGTVFEKSGDAGCQKRVHAFIEMPRHQC